MSRLNIFKSFGVQFSYVSSLWCASNRFIPVRDSYEINVPIEKLFSSRLSYEKLCNNNNKFLDLDVQLALLSINENLVCADIESTLSRTI